MPVTMSEIARRLGLSQPAVSQALNGKGRLPEATRRRILAMASELGFRPSLSARATRSGRLGCVALLQSSQDRRNLLPPRLLDGIHDALAEREQHLVVVKLGDGDQARPAAVPRILRERMADGMIVNIASEIPAGIQALIREHGVPAVWMNGLRDADCVRPDDLGAAREATGRLLAMGHRRILYLDHAHGRDPSRAHYSAQHRRDGYAQAMREAGLEPRLDTGLAEALPLPERAERCRALLAAPERPSAILAYSPKVAGPALVAAAAVGLRLPRDLAMMTFADSDPAALGIALDAMLVPEFELGQAAVEMLFAILADGTAGRPSRILPCTFAAAGSALPA